jgi:hypothetical protein
LAGTSPSEKDHLKFKLEVYLFVPVRAWSCLQALEPRWLHLFLRDNPSVDMASK